MGATVHQVKASVLHGARDLRIEERTLPPLSPTDVHVAVHATGLCGSDLHYFNHYRNGDIIVQEPLTLGHESAGTITAVGSEVTSLRVGDHVALEVGQPCEQCGLCLEGRYNICSGMRFRSSAKAFPHAQGTLQEVISHPAKWCHKLPPSVSLDLGALSEPLSVALHASDRANVPQSSTILVFGAGAVGLLCAAVSKVVDKATKVVIADIQADRVNFAVQNGFADAGVVVPMPAKRPETIEEKLAFAKEVADLVKGTRVKSTISGEPETRESLVGDVTATYECTGVESCLQSAIYATSPGGKIMLIGMGNPIQTLPISAASLREVDLVGVFRYAKTYPRAIELLSAGGGDDGKSSVPSLPALVSKLITHRYKGMENIPRAFDMAARVKDDDGNLVIKVVVDM